MRLGALQRVSIERFRFQSLICVTCKSKNRRAGRVGIWPISESAEPITVQARQIVRKPHQAFQVSERQLARVTCQATCLLLEFRGSQINVARAPVKAFGR